MHELFRSLALYGNVPATATATATLVLTVAYYTCRGGEMGVAFLPFPGAARARGAAGRGEKESEQGGAGQGGGGQVQEGQEGQEEEEQNRWEQLSLFATGQLDDGGDFVGVPFFAHVRFLLCPSSLPPSPFLGASPTSTRLVVGHASFHFSVPPSPTRFSNTFTLTHAKRHRHQ